MTKVCGTCKQTLPIEEFNKANAAKDGRQSRCKKCFKETYTADKAAQVARVTARNLAHRKLLKEFVWNLKRKPCADCNQSYHPVAMDFDHVTGTKVADINRLVRSCVSWKKLNEELAKCELVCSNCHRIRTFKRSGLLASVAEMV